MAWVFLLTTTVDRRRDRAVAGHRPAILIVLAFSGLFVVVVHDLLPSDTLGPAKFVVEGSVAITVATLLVALTGGVASPFFFAFPLIVGGAALVVFPPITLTLVTAAAIGYLLAVVAGSPAHLGTGDGRGRRGQPDGADSRAWAGSAPTTSPPPLGQRSRSSLDTRESPASLARRGPSPN